MSFAQAASRIAEKKAAAATVKDHLQDGPIRKSIDPEVLAVPAESVVGKTCIEFAKLAEQMIAVDSGNVEPSMVAALRQVVRHQCNVWLFG